MYLDLIEKFISVVKMMLCSFCYTVSTYNSLFHMKITVSVKDWIKIVDCAIYTYLHSPLWLEKKKYCDHCFPQQIRPQTTVQ